MSELIQVYIDDETMAFLEHAQKETGYSITRLAEISTANAAHDHARRHNLTFDEKTKRLK